MLNLLVLDDILPELAESFQIMLVSAESGDGKPGSTPTSGASIDPNNSVNTVTVTASDHPYGIYSHAQKQHCLTLSAAISSNRQSVLIRLCCYKWLIVSAEYECNFHCLSLSCVQYPPSSITLFPSFLPCSFLVQACCSFNQALQVKD